MELEVVSCSISERCNPPRFCRRSLSEFNAAPRVFVSPEGETIWENLENRSSRPYNDYCKAIQDTVRAEFGIPADKSFKLNWHQYAGCRTCPCSPGFLVQCDGFYIGRKDLHITIQPKKEN